MRRRIEGRREKGEGKKGKRISNIEQGMSNLEVRFFAALRMTSMNIQYPPQGVLWRTRNNE
jgi:hypothetical protein